MPKCPELECISNSKVFSDASLKQHLQNKHIDKNCKAKKALGKQKKHAPTGTEPCLACNKKFKTQKAVEDHTKSKHLQEQLSKLEDENTGLKKQNTIMVTVLGLQYLTPLPPNDAKNVKEFCDSAKPSKVEKQSMDCVFKTVKSQLTSVLIKSYTVEKVVQGGSTAQGTSVKGRFDLDVVVFVKGFESQKMDFYKEEAKSVLKCARFTWLRETPAASVYKFEDVDIDVLFTGEYKGKYPITYADDATRFYMASLTEKQVKYVEDNTGPIELDCIRGIKKCIKTGEWASLKPPSSYLIAVLVIHIKNELKQDRVPAEINDLHGLFGLVIKCLSNLGIAEIKTDKQNKPPSITKPYVLDPINEHNNLLSPLNSCAIALIVKSGADQYLD